MVLKFSSFTTPLGHSWNWQRNLKVSIKTELCKLSPNTPEPRQSSNWTRRSRTYIFEASVEHLQLFFGELCLLLQFVHAFRSVTNSGELKVIFHAVCVTKRRQLADTVASSALSPGQPPVMTWNSLQSNATLFTDKIKTLSIQKSTNASDLHNKKR